MLQHLDMPGAARCCALQHLAMARCCQVLCAAAPGYSQVLCAAAPVHARCCSGAAACLVCGFGHIHPNSVDFTPNLVKYYQFQPISLSICKASDAVPLLFKSEHFSSVCCSTWHGLWSGAARCCALEHLAMAGCCQVLCAAAPSMAGCYALQHLSECGAPRRRRALCAPWQSGKESAVRQK